MRAALSAPSPWVRSPSPRTSRAARTSRDACSRRCDAEERPASERALHPKRERPRHVGVTNLSPLRYTAEECVVCASAGPGYRRASRMRLWLLVLCFAVTGVLAATACTTNGDAPGGTIVDEPGAPSAVDPSASPSPAPSSAADADLVDGNETSLADASTTDPRDAAREAETIVAANACADYAAPTVASRCHGCPAGKVCQANGCWGGYWCDVPAVRCVMPPSSCVSRVSSPRSWSVPASAR